MVRVGIVALIGVAAFLLFARAVERDLNHDEHQFLAPSALLTTANATEKKASLGRADGSPALKRALTLSLRGADCFQADLRRDQTLIFIALDRECDVPRRLWQRLRRSIEPDRATLAIALPKDQAEVFFLEDARLRGGRHFSGNKDWFRIGHAEWLQRRVMFEQRETEVLEHQLSVDAETRLKLLIA